MITNSTQLQDCLNELQNWLTNNNLLLNHNKTELLNITNDTNTYYPDIIINQHKISTNTVKYLGVYFNNKLKARSQCSDILFILHVVDWKYIGLFKYRLQYNSLYLANFVCIMFTLYKCIIAKNKIF